MASNRALLIIASLSLALTACDGDGDGDSGLPNPSPIVTPSPTPAPAPSQTPTPVTPTAVTVDFSFDGRRDGWLADYVDYQNGQESSIAFHSELARLPGDLGNRGGFLLTSNNRPDDIFMFLTRPVSGLAPRQLYRIETEVTFATDKPAGCFGIGGDPGKGVVVKAGASAAIPGRVLEDRTDGGTVLRANYDKGEQETSGKDLNIIGDFAQEQPGGSCDLNAPFQLKTVRSRGVGATVRSDENGRLWLIFGTESGYEGLTTIYYLGGRMALSPIAG